MVFDCTECHKQFSIRIGKSKLAPLQRDMNADAPEETDEETDELIRSFCMKKEDVERLKGNGFSNEVFIPARRAG